MMVDAETKPIHEVCERLMEDNERNKLFADDIGGVRGQILSLGF